MKPNNVARRATLLSLPVLAGAMLGGAAHADGVKQATPSRNAPECLTCGDGKVESLEELEQEFRNLDDYTEDQVASFAAEILAARGEAAGEIRPAVVPIAVSVLVNCALNAAWVFRNGVSSDEAAMKVAEVIVGCVGLPGASWAVIRVARLVWTHRRKIAAALSAAGLTAAQVAPLINARRP